MGTTADPVAMANFEFTARDIEPLVGQILFQNIGFSINTVQYRCEVWTAVDWTDHCIMDRNPCDVEYSADVWTYHQI